MSQDAFPAGFPLDQPLPGEGRPSHEMSLARRTAEAHLRGFLRSLEAIVWEADTDARRVTFVSNRAERLLGYQRERWLSAPDFFIDHVHPGDRAAVLDALAAASKVPGDHDFEYRAISLEGHTVWLRSLLYAEPDEEARVYRLLGITLDITEHRRDGIRLAAQAAATRALVESESLAEAVPSVLQALCESLGWDLGVLWMLDDQLEVLRCAYLWCDGDLETSDFVRRTRRIVLNREEGLPGLVWARSLSEWMPDFAVAEGFPLAVSARDAGLHGAVAFPVTVGRKIVGVMEFFSREVRPGDDQMRELMAGVGVQLGHALLRQAEQERAQATVIRSEERAHFLIQAGGILAASLDADATLESIAQLAVPFLADWCIFDVIDESGRIGRAAVAQAADPQAADPSQQLLRVTDGAGLPAGAAAMAEESWGEPAKVTDPAAAELLRQIGAVSHVRLPLMARNRILGSVTFALTQPGRRYDPEEIVLAREIAHRTALALDRTRLYQERAYIADTLQRSLLPPMLPAIRGLDIAARYRAAGRGLAAGGDFYDVFNVGGRSWAVVLGDVCGKGPEAAALTALARYTVRAAALRARRPNRILALLNEAIGAQAVDQFCTAIYARIDAMESGVRVALSVAGHPLPLLVRASGTVETAGRPGGLLGPFPTPRLLVDTIAMAPGDLMLLYTDGCSEARSPAGFLGDGALGRAAAEWRHLDADQIAGNVERLVLEYQDNEPRDDVALLVVKVPS